jgi:hypothetical protein
MVKLDNVVTEDNRIVRFSGLPGTDDTMTEIDVFFSYSTASNVSMNRSARTLDKIVIPMIIKLFSDYVKQRKALEQAKEALYNVPMVGELYDQQHSDTHMNACLAIDKALE